MVFYGSEMVIIICHRFNPSLHDMDFAPACYVYLLVPQLEKNQEIDSDYDLSSPF